MKRFLDYNGLEVLWGRIKLLRSAAEQAVEEKLKGYLPLSGGTMTGDIAMLNGKVQAMEAQDTCLRTTQYGAFSIDILDNYAEEGGGVVEHELTFPTKSGQLALDADLQKVRETATENTDKIDFLVGQWVNMTTDIETLTKKVGDIVAIPAETINNLN